MNTTLFYYESAGFTIASGQALSPEAIAQVIQLMLQDRPEKNLVLEGRRSAVFGQLPGVGPIVVKHYARGGVLGRFVNSLFLRLGPVRAEVEFTTLMQVRSLGIRAPEPVLFAFRGKWLYQTWLVTRELEGHKNLMELARNQADNLLPVLEQVVLVLQSLIRNRITHIDLHPGNILVDAQGQVAVIDFDKAYQWQGSLRQLRDVYLRRWRRAVIKHGLPDLLAEFVSAGLRQHFDEDSLR
jgi:3-deoxy-D-manno-octulosonic acid kinase